MSMHASSSGVGRHGIRRAGDVKSASMFTESPRAEACDLELGAGGSGLDVLRAARSTKALLVLTTGSGGPERDEALRSGFASSVLEKPIPRSALQALFLEVASRRHA